MIPDRSPESKNRSLTMLSYQVMPMLPKPSNAVQRQIVAKAETLSNKCVKLPKPKKVSTRAKTVAEGHAARNKREVMELFSNGPLTVNMLWEIRGYKFREAAAYKINEWKKRGLIVEHKPKEKQPPGQTQKWWKMK